MRKGGKEGERVEGRGKEGETVGQTVGGRERKEGGGGTITNQRITVKFQSHEQSNNFLSLPWKLIILVTHIVMTIYLCYLLQEGREKEVNDSCRIIWKKFEHRGQKT